jgi:hypothetical protein
MVFNATFNNISVKSWWSVLLVEETGGHRETTDLSQITDHKTILTLPLFYRSACTKLGKGVVMYLCITGIDCDSFCYFSVGFF